MTYSHDLLSVNINFAFFEGMICSTSFKFDYIEDKSSINEINISMKSSDFKTFFPSLTSQTALKISFQPDKCKKGEIYSGKVCFPCPLNTFSTSENLRGSTWVYLCSYCNDQDEFFCYGADLRSPKKNYWRISSESNRFLRCPGTKCLGDPFFQKNSSEIDCEECLIPGTKSKIYSFDRTFTAIGVCAQNYKGALCSECSPGFGTTDNFECSDCLSNLVYVKQAFLLFIKMIIFFLFVA